MRSKWLLPINSPVYFGDTRCFVRKVFVEVEEYSQVVSYLLVPEGFDNPESGFIAKEEHVLRRGGRHCYLTPSQIATEANRNRVNGAILAASVL